MWYDCRCTVPQLASDTLVIVNRRRAQSKNDYNKYHSWPCVISGGYHEPISVDTNGDFTYFGSKDSSLAQWHE